MENITIEKRNVFISYCHKDTTEEWIDKLAITLGQYGINCIVDIYDLLLGQDLPYFMEQIKKVDKVLILLGKIYKERANEREGGVGTETQIISNDVYNDVEQTKFIPIVINKDEKGNAYLPYYLESRLYTDFSDDNQFAQNIEALARQIHKLPKRIKPVVMEPPTSLIQHNQNAGMFLVKSGVTFMELEAFITEEMKKIKCTHDEYEKEKDDIILKRIEESKEIRDIYIKNLSIMFDRGKISTEEVISFIEKAYNISNSFENGTYYNEQNDGCHFFLQEIIIYTIAILYKRKMFKEIRQLIKTTYFPESDRSFVRSGIRLEYFFYYLKSLDYRNDRLKLNRSSLQADILMQRASVLDVNISFNDIRFADSLIMILSEWFYKDKQNYCYWYPVTITYSDFDDYLQLKKYLVSASRFQTIKELFDVNNEQDFIRRYTELDIIFKGEKRRTSSFHTLPSICSIVKENELFSKD